jgi:hypothetical protein
VRFHGTVVGSSFPTCFFGALLNLPQTRSAGAPSLAAIRPAAGELNTAGPLPQPGPAIPTTPRTRSPFGVVPRRINRVRFVTERLTVRCGPISSRSPRPALRRGSQLQVRYHIAGLLFLKPPGTAPITHLIASSTQSESKHCRIIDDATLRLRSSNFFRSSQRKQSGPNGF